MTETTGSSDGLPTGMPQNNPLSRKLNKILDTRLDSDKVNYIFDQSLNSGDLPADWTLANVAPIFKKGSKLPSCISNLYYL